jgi:hypothetical protein
LRGLHFLYECESAVDPERLVTALQDEHGGRLVTRSTRLGAHPVATAVLQFRFEVQVGPEPRAVSFMHRMCVEESSREPERARFERVLERVLEDAR